MLKEYQTPQNLVERLDSIVEAASRTEFYSRSLTGRAGVLSLEDFHEIPVTPLTVYRRQRLGDVISRAAEIEWIVGAYAGQTPDRVAVTEGPEEGATRHDLFMDAVKQGFQLAEHAVGAILTPPGRRFFAAEVGAILIRAGVPTHVFIDKGGPRTYDFLSNVRPGIVVILSSEIDEARLPDGVELCVTFGRSQRMARLDQLDLYHVDELGYLGQSTDCESYVLNRDEYYFETSENDRLVVTSLFNRVQPMLRIETMDRVKSLGEDGVEFADAPPRVSAQD